MYNPEDIKTLSGAEIVRKRPEMYFGTNGPTPSAICSGILEGALVLGSKKVVVENRGDWWLIASDIDWLNATNKFGTNEDNAFLGLRAFPENGVNSIRSEIFAFVFSSCLISKGPTKTVLIKGNKKDKDDFSNIVSSLTTYKRVVGFKFEHVT